MIKRSDPNRVSNYATTINSIGGFTNCIYHHTAIVSWNQDAIILDSGGYLTATTKKKMNQISNQFNLGYRVYQDDFIWHVTYKGKTIPYKDHMELTR